MALPGEFFDLSEDQRALVEEARRFAQAEIAPVAAKYDASGEFPRDIIVKGADLGLSRNPLQSNAAH